MNGRPLGQSCETYPSDEEAIQVAQRMQEWENKVLMESTEKGLPRRAVPKIEVLKLIWEGEPRRAHPERIGERRRRIEKAMNDCPKCGSKDIVKSGFAEGRQIDCRSCGARVASGTD